MSFELFWPHVIRLLTKYLRYLKLHSYIETSTNLDRPEKSVETDAHMIDVIEQWILRVLTSYEWILATFFIFCTMWLSSSLLALQRTLYLIGLCFFFVDAHILGFVSSITLTYNDTATLDNTINVSYKDNTLQYLITIYHLFYSKLAKKDNLMLLNWWWIINPGFLVSIWILNMWMEWLMCTVIRYFRVILSTI